jgi:2-haloacid dehalogenase
MPDLSAIRALTFDCYGTLVDWEPGILGAVRPVLRRRGIEADDGRILSLFARLEAEEEGGPYRPYRRVLAGVMDRLAAELGAGPLPDRERGVLAESLPRWPVFADAAPFLRRARGRFVLGVCSNVDDDLFDATRRTLGAPVDWVVTAESCRSYKPAEAHFRVALARLGLPAERVLHVAESRRHDIEPASRLGFRTAWVNRHRARPGPSASGEGSAVADLEVGGLDELASVLGL